MNSIRSWQRTASCLGKVCACVRVCTHGRGGWQRERHVGGGTFDATWTVTPLFPGTGRHLQSSSGEVKTNTCSACIRSVRAALPLQQALAERVTAKHAFELESQSFLQNNSKSLLTLKPFLMLPSF